MKRLLVAKLIRRIIQEEATNFFQSTLEKFDNDLDALLSSEKDVQEINGFLEIKEKYAINYIKQKYNFDFEQFDERTQLLILNDVENKIFSK